MSGSRWWDTTGGPTSRSGRRWTTRRPSRTSRCWTGCRSWKRWSAVTRGSRRRGGTGSSSPSPRSPSGRSWPIRTRGTAAPRSGWAARRPTRTTGQRSTTRRRSGRCSRTTGPGSESTAPMMRRTGRLAVASPARCWCCGPTATTCRRSTATCWRSGAPGHRTSAVAGSTAGTTWPRRRRASSRRSCWRSCAEPQPSTEADEHPAREALDQVRGGRPEGDHLIVGRDHAADAVAVPLPARARDADALGGARLAVVEEDVAGAVGVARYEVARAGVEQHEAAVGRERGDVAVAVGLAAVRGDADSHRGPRETVAHEHVALAVGITGHEVARGGIERDDEALVGDEAAGDDLPRLGDDEPAAVAVGLTAACGDADPLRHAEAAVAEEDVHLAVAVAGDEVGGCRIEDHEAAVARDARAAAVAVALLVVRADAGALCCAEPPVTDENVVAVVGVARHHEGRVGVEDHEAAVGRQGVPVGLELGVEHAAGAAAAVDQEVGAGAPVDDVRDGVAGRFAGADLAQGEAAVAGYRHGRILLGAAADVEAGPGAAVVHGAGVACAAEGAGGDRMAEREEAAVAGDAERRVAGVDRLGRGRRRGAGRAGKGDQGRQRDRDPAHDRTSVVLNTSERRRPGRPVASGGAGERTRGYL